LQDTGEGDAAAFEEIEEAAVNLCRAWERLTKPQKDILQHAMNTVSEKGALPSTDLMTLLPHLVIVCSTFADKNPLRDGAKGNITTGLTLQHLVYTLWKWAHDCDGDLNASKNDKTYYGPMFRALEVISGHLTLYQDQPPLFSPQQRSTVVNIVKKAKRGVYPVPLK
jgi:hypothetical protein